VLLRARRPVPRLIKGSPSRGFAGAGDPDAIRTDLGCRPPRVSETLVKWCCVHHAAPCANGVRTAVGRACSASGHSVQKGGIAPAIPAAIAASASSSATRTWRRSGRPDRTALGTSHLTTDRARFLGFGLSQRAGTDAAKCPVSLWLCRDAGRSLPINKICPERSAGRERRQGAPTRLAPVRTKRRASSAVKRR
jgi:hypothetical protein